VAAVVGLGGGSGAKRYLERPFLRERVIETSGICVCWGIWSDSTLNFESNHKDCSGRRLIIGATKYTMDARPLLCTREHHAMQPFREFNGPKLCECMSQPH